MAKYRKIDPRIWNDKNFREFSNNGKLAFIFLLTHPFMTSVGAMRGTAQGLAAELNWPEKAFGEAFQEALDKRMVKYDSVACFIWVPNFVKYNKPESPNTLKAWADALDLLPECALFYELLQHIKAYSLGLSEAFQKALPEAFAKTSPILEQEQEQEQEQEKDIGTGAQAPAPSVCPHQEIIALYHEILPGLPRVKEWTDQRQGFLRTRWREKQERQNLEWWAGFFERVKDSDFLSGRLAGKDFMADMEWLVRPTNFLKVIEGRYDNRIPKGKQLDERDETALRLLRNLK